MNHVTNLATTFARRSFVVIAAAALISGFFVSTAFADPTPTTLTITSPNGGEIWSGTHNITWSSTGGTPGVDTVSLVYSTNDFITQSLIVGSEGLAYDIGTFSWNTTTVPDGTSYKVKVVTTNGLVYDPSNANFSVDNTAPTISSVSIPDAAMNIGDTVTATITVGNDAGVTYTLVSGAIDGFTLGSLVRTSVTTYTATFTVTEGGADVLAGSDIPVASLVLADTASAPNQSAAFNGSVSPAGAADSIDANSPTLSSVTIASNNANPVWAKTGDVVTVSFTSNESIGTPTVTIAGQNAVEAGGPTVWTATYTMQAGDAEGVVPFTIDFADLATNAGVQVTAITSGSNVTYDETLPSIAFTQDVEVGPVTSDTVNLTVTETNGNTATYFYGFSADTVCDGTDTYDVAYSSATPFTLNTEANNTKYICAKAVDNAGNTGYSAASANDLNIDVTAPVIASISMPTGIYNIGDSFTVTITADAAGYTAGTITVNGVAVTGFTDAGLGVYTATYTVVEGHTDVLAAAVPTASVTLKDSVLNENTAFTTVTESGGDVVIDATRPTVGVVVTDTALSVGETTLVTFTFSEVVTGFTNADLTIPNGGLTAVSSGDSGITWTATFTPTADTTDVTNVFTVAMTGLTDIATNAGAGTTNSNNFAIDTLRPTVGVVLTDTALAAGETSLVTFTFSEVPTDFDATDVTVANGAIGAVSATGNPLVFEATYTPTADTMDATNIMTVGTGWTDPAGNAPATPTDSLNYTIDTLRPTVGIVLNDSALKIGETATITFTFSEVPTGFTGADVTVGSGAIGAIDDTNPLVQTAVFTPTANTEDAINVVTVGTGWTDPNGNAPVSSTDSANYAVDTKAPTAVSVVLADSALKAGDTSLVTITFSEAVLLFTNADITTIEGGTLDAVSSGDGGTTWTATFTPTAGLEDATNSITVDATGVTDVAGNAGTGTATSANYVIDTLLPTLTSVGISSNNTTPTLAKQGDVVTLAFTSSEAISAPTVLIQGVAATSITNPAGNNWVATRTMGGADTEGAVAFSVAFADTPAGNNGVTVTAVTDASSVLYDRTNPSVDAGTNKEVNATVSQDATTSDGGSGIATHAWTKISGPGTITFGTPTTVDTTISANADGTYVLRLTVIDNAGNSAFDEITFIWDTTNPEPLTASPSDGATGVAITAGTATVTYDEDIVLLDGSRVLLVNDVTSASYKGTVAVSGGNGASAILNIPYSGLEYGTKYRINVKPNALEDVAGNNLATNFISYFTTIIDTVVPVVNSASAGTITTTGAVLSVTTDESATCSYATTDSAYGSISMTAFDVPNTGTSHTATLAGLTPSTGYDYFVRCADTSAQTNTMTTSAHVSFTTATPDTDAPAISNIQATSISSSGATITWTTNELATSRVEYGLTSAYGSLPVPADPTADNTTHSVTISGLTSGTTYHFRVLSTDGAFNAGTSGDNSFDTVVVLDSTTPPAPVITTDTATVNSDAYQISGTAGADTPAPTVRTISVYNGATLAGTAVVPVGQTGWSVSVTLTQSTVNSFTAISADASGNVSAASSAVVITEDGTVGADVTAPDAPVIDVDIDGIIVDADTYEINGTLTDDSGVRTVSVFESGSVIGTAVLPTGQTDWAVTVTLLQDVDNTITAKATDEAGNTSAASDSVIITEATAADTTAPVSSNIQATGITTSAATITWDTDENATDLVEYGLTSSYGSMTVVDLTANLTSHSVALSGLTAGTEYHYRVVSADSLGNTASSTDSTFTSTVAADTTAPGVPTFTTVAATIDANTYTLAGVVADDGGTRVVSIYNGATLAGTVSVPAGDTTWSFLAPLTQVSANSFTATASDVAGNTSVASAAVVITEATATDDTTDPATPVITTGDTTVDADTYTISGTAGADAPTDGTRTVTIYRDATVVGSISLPAGTTAWSFIAALTQTVANSFTAYSTDEAGNTSVVSNTVVITEAEGTASLAVTDIDAVGTFATADDTYGNGWSWTFYITVPTDEPEFAMKFADFTSGGNTILAASNIRYYSAQSTEADTTGEAVTIAGANTYPGNITLDGDLDAGTAGRQIAVTVEMKVPVGSAGGSYSAQYGVSSDTATP